MTRTPTPSRHTPLPPPAVLRIVAGLVGMIFARLIPALVHRPDLRAPLLRATRALAMAGWAYALKREGAHVKLRSAVRALRDVLLRIVEQDEGWPSQAPSSRTEATPRLAGRLTTRSPGPRARDGPFPARSRAA